MRSALPILLSVLLCHCGTHVGNGITGDDKAPDKSTATAGSAPQSPSSAENSDAPNLQLLSTYFLAACASPFSESIEGTFANAQGTPKFKVAVLSDGKKTITPVNGSVLYTITSAPAVSPYAIEALPVSPAVTCSTVSNQTLSVGKIQRSVTLTGGLVVSWILDSNTVVALKVVSSNESEEFWSKTAD